MASSTLRNDSCSYQEQLRRSVGPGMYQLTTPANDGAQDGCHRDIPADPFIRYQAWGPNACVPGSSVDDGSELLGLRYKNSMCADDYYMPGKYSSKGLCGPPGKANPRSCMAPTENTRLSNPPCTLRSTGWNRWEWLCWDPQDRALVPFEWNTPYRIVVKDNHTPVLETPIDQGQFQPKGASDGRDFRNPIGPYESHCSSAQAPGNPFAVYSVGQKNIAAL